jgi:5-methylcytosine-specific restriction endonuclease McrA
MTITAQERIEKIGRAEMLAALIDRDGTKCQYAECGMPLDFSIDYQTLDIEDPRRKLEPTIDHWIPQHFGKANGWTYEEIWDLNNLKLMHKKCNAKKGDRIPNEDGTLPERIVRKFRYRRDKRAGRAEACVACDNGHNLVIGEICGSCGCDAQRFPRWAKVRYNECDHDIMWCYACSITPDMRPPAHVSAMRQAEAGEEDGLYGE